MVYKLYQTLKIKYREGIQFIREVKEGLGILLEACNNTEEMDRIHGEMFEHQRYARPHEYAQEQRALKKERQKLVEVLDKRTTNLIEQRESQY